MSSSIADLPIFPRSILGPMSNNLCSQTQLFACFTSAYGHKGSRQSRSGSNQIEHHVPIESNEAVELAFEQPFLIAV